MTPFVWIDDAGRPWKVGPFGEPAGTKELAAVVWVFWWDTRSEAWVPLREFNDRLDSWMGLKRAVKQMPPEQAHLLHELSERHR